MTELSNKTYYELLGVSKEATLEEIKTSYKEIARIYHPDSNFYTEIIEDRIDGDEMSVFKAITAAYNTLIDAEKRALYNQTLPPDLKDWEDSHADVWTKPRGPHSGAFDPASDKLQTVRKNTVGTGAVFGATPRKSAFDGFGNPDVQSMADIIRGKRGPGLKGKLLGFLDKILRR